MMKLESLFKVLMLILFISSLLHLNHTSAQTAETRTLPNDIVFTVSDEMPGPINRGNTLVLVSADTLEPVEFYTDESADEVRAISWSPQADKLAVWHAEYEGISALISTCIITITGEHQICFDDVPDVNDQYAVYPVTWSDDGQQVYLVVEDGDGVNLVERDVATGETIRTLYQSRRQSPDQIFPSKMVWTPDLHYIAVGVGYPYQNDVGVLVNLETGDEQDLSEIVIPWPGGLATDVPPNAGYVCGSFSPQGTYMTAIDYSDLEHGDRLIVFDMELQEIASITEFNTPDSPMSLDDCPTWNDNEDQLYIYGRSEADQTRHIFVYSLTDHQIVSHFESEALFPPLFLSPDQTHLAFVGFTDWYQVNILDSDGDVWQVTDQYTFSGYPLWRPSPQ